MTHNINWTADFQYNEPLHEGARTIYATYVRLTIKYPSHTDCKKWDELQTEWINYERNISDLNLASEQLAEVEVSRVLKIAKEVLALETELDRLNHISVSN